MCAYVNSNRGCESGVGWKSRSGAIIKRWSSAILTMSVLLQCVALSSTEAEFVALSEAFRTVVWLRCVLHEYGIQQNATTIYQYSDSIMCWSKVNRAQQMRKQKHLEIHYHYVVDMVRAN